MKLRRLEVWNFRAFGHAAIEFPESGVLLIAGANNSGKTALLSAIDMIAGGTMSEMNHHGSSEPASMVATFALDEGDRAHLLRDVHVDYLIESAAFREVQWKYREMVTGHGLTPIQVTTPWPKRDQLVLIEYFTENGLGTIRRSDTHRILEGQSDSEVAFKFAQLASDFTIEPSGLRGQSPRFGRFKPLLDYLRTWCAGMYHFKALRPGTMTDTHQVSAADRLDPTGLNLPAVLTHLYHNRPEIYRKLDRLLQQIVPGIGELQLPLEGSQTRITFRDPDMPDQVLNLKSLGTGVEQLLMTLVVGLMDGGPSGVIVEEPETNLHPGAQRALMTHIRRWSSDRPYILATHSPVLLDTAEPAEVLLVTRDAGTSQVRSLGNEALEALDELGVRLSDVLSADRLLLVEGPTDKGILGVWFPEYIGNPRVAVIVGVGGENAKYARHLQTWLSAADRLGDRRVLYLRDRDELQKADVDKLESGGYVQVPLRREIENYLLDPEALAKIIQERRPGSASPEGVTTVMRQLADSLQPTVVLKRVCWRLQPPRLIDHQLRKKLAQAGADLTQLQTTIAERAKGPDEIKAEAATLWQEESTQVAADWETSWLALAPGEEVLKGLWNHFNMDGYSKKADGPKIASKMSEPPEELKKILSDFIDETST